MKKNLIKTFAFMFSAMFLAKILGLVRNMVFASCYGTGAAATAFFTASRIPLQLLDLTLGAAISSTFIPVFNEYIQKKGKEKAIAFANNFLNVIIVISLLLSILGTIFAGPIVKVIAPELDVETMNLTVELSRTLFPVLFFTAVAYVFVGFLQSLDEFNIPAIISVVSNGILILYLLVFNDKFGVQGAAVGMLIGWGTQIIVQLPAAIKKGFKYSFKVDFKDEGLKKIVKLALPILISSWVQPINNIVNLRLASGLEGGEAVSAIEYAYTLYLIVVGVFSYTLSNIIFPELSKLSADSKKDEFVKVLNKSLKISIFFIIPMAVGIGFLSTSIIGIIYERGEFTAHSTDLTAAALMFYAIGMIGYGIMEVLNKAFYAMQDAKTPMIVSAIAIVLNIILSIVFVNMIGYIGLPLAASITSLLTAVIMMWRINKKCPGIVDKTTFIESLKTICAASVMAIVLYLLKSKFDFSRFVLIFVSVALGVITYFGMACIVKNEFIKDGMEFIENRTKNK